MIEKYKQSLIKHALILDNASNSNGVITLCAKNFAEGSDDLYAKKLYAIINKIADSRPSLIPMARDLNESLITLVGYRQLLSICGNNNRIKEEEKNLSSLIEDLNGLVGLEQVKSKVQDLISYHKVQLYRKKYGLSVPKNTLHLSFTGNPGTGKTTVARIVGRIYKQIGLLSSGHFLEVSRTDLIAGYQGQTALKVKNVIEKAKGGVLFIDEAYSITENENSDSYGRECLTELTKALEDYREDLVVIVAGYTEPMMKFFDSNPGLKSRFNTFIDFDDYNEQELLDILEGMCKKEDYILSEEIIQTLKTEFERKVKNKGNEFSNGRYVRNLFEDMIINHARRLVSNPHPTIDELKILQATDLPHFN